MRWNKQAVIDNIFDRRRPVTSVILIVTILHFLLLQIFRFGQATSATAIYEFGGMYGEVIKSEPTQLWRLITASFVHIGRTHILMNSISIYFLGRQLEDLFGSMRFAIIYLLSGIMGNAAAMVLTSTLVVAGASTSIFGLFALMAVLYVYTKNPYIKQLGQTYLLLLLLNLISGFTISDVSNVGHIGGAIGGALCAIFLPLRGEEYTFSSKQRLLAIVTYIVLLALAILVNHLLPR